MAQSLYLPENISEGDVRIWCNQYIRHGFGISWCNVFGNGTQRLSLTTRNFWRGEQILVLSVTDPEEFVLAKLRWSGAK